MSELVFLTALSVDHSLDVCIAASASDAYAGWLAGTHMPSVDCTITKVGRLENDDQPPNVILSKTVR